MIIKRSLFLLSLCFISSISVFSSISNFIDNKSLTKNSKKDIKEEQKSSSNNNSKIDKDTEALNLNTNFSPLHSESSSTISIYSKGLVGFDKTNKKLVLTSFEGKEIWKSNVIYNNEIRILSIAYNKLINQIGVLFIENETDLFLNVFNANNGKSIKGHVSIQGDWNTNRKNNKFFKLNSTPNEASFLIYSSDHLTVETVDSSYNNRKGTSYLVNLFQNNFQINKIIASYTNELNGSNGISNNNEKTLLIQRYYDEAKKDIYYFMITYNETQNNFRRTFNFRVFDEQFRTILYNNGNGDSKSIELLSSSLKDNNGWDKKIGASFLFSNVNFNLNINFIINYNRDFSIGSVSLDRTNSKIIGFDSFKLNDSTNNIFNVNNYSINDEDGYFSGIAYIKSNDSQLNNKQGKNIFLINKKELTNLNSIKSLKDFINTKVKLHKINSDFESNNYNNNESVGFYDDKIYYSILKDSKGLLKKFDKEFRISWNTEFIKNNQNELVYNSDNYYTLLPQEKIKEFMLSNLNQAVIQNNNFITEINIKSIENLNDNDSNAIINNTIVNQRPKILYSIRNFYSNGTFISQETNKEVYINFVYNKEKLPKILKIDLLLKNKDNTIIQDVSFGEKITIDSNVSKTDNILENDLSYKWFFKKKNSTVFEVLQNNDKKLVIDSFKESNSGTYKLLVEYKKLVGNNNTPIIFKSSEKIINLLDSTTPRLNSVTVIPNATNINYSNVLNMRIIEDYQNVDKSKLSYQWYFNNVPINGETSTTLTINDFKPLNVGKYYIQVTSTQENLDVKTIKSNVVDIFGVINTSDSIKNFSIGLNDKDILGNPVVYQLNNGIYQVEKKENVIGLLRVIKDVANDKKDKLKYKFGQYDPVTGIYVNSTVVTSKYTDNEKIIIPFNQVGTIAYKFELWIDGIDSSLVTSTIVFNFKEYINIDKNNPINVNVANTNNIKSGSNVVLGYTNNSKFVFNSYSWYYRNETMTDYIKLEGGSVVDKNYVSLEIKEFNWTRDGWYKLEGKLEDGREVYLEEIYLKSGTEVSLKSNLNYKNNFNWTLASQVSKTAIENILDINVNLNNYIVNYEYAANDFEGYLLLIPSIISVNSLQEVRKLDSIKIEGFMQVKWIILGSSLSLVFLISIIIFIILKIKKVNKYNIDRVILADKKLFLANPNRILLPRDPIVNQRRTLDSPKINLLINGKNASNQKTNTRANVYKPISKPVNNYYPRQKEAPYSRPVQQSNYQNNREYSPYSGYPSLRKPR